MKKACGGVVIAPDGRVLLRRPAGLHKTRIWTFAKGKPEPGEEPEQTALREVLEETGVVARIILKLELGAGPSGRDEYFLMTPLEDRKTYDDETAAVVWATKEEAEELISLTGDDERRLRDLVVLQAAFDIFNSTRPLGLERE